MNLRLSQGRTQFLNTQRWPRRGLWASRSGSRDRFNKLQPPDLAVAINVRRLNLVLQELQLLTISRPHSVLYVRGK